MQSTQRLLRLISSLIPGVKYSELIGPSEARLNGNIHSGAYRFVSAAESKRISAEYLKSKEAYPLV